MMDVDGKRCEAEEVQRRKANKYACWKLLERLEKYHSEPEVSPPSEPIVIAKCDDDDLPPRALMISRIQQVVCRHFNVRHNELLSERRYANLVQARQVAYYLAKELTSLSFPAIGRRFGGRDHTTVLSGVRKISRMISADPGFAKSVHDLEERIR
jgi:chromosomal replication initiation ATPase DnaA